MDAALAGLIGAAIGAVAGMSGSIIASRNARKLAEDGRIWDRRADIYWRTVTLAVFDRLHNPEYPVDVYVRHLLGCRGELELWGSTEVRRLADEVVKTAPIVDGTQNLRYDEDLHMRWISQLADQCRTELQKEGPAR